jgi:predicted MFS family arabinose efflux permease
MCLGVALIGQVGAAWQLYPCFMLIGVGWSTLSTTGIAATVAPWFERHQGRSMTLAIMGASVGAIVGVPLLLLAVGKFGLASGLIVTATVATLVLLPLIARALRFRGPAEIGQRRDGDSTPLDQAASPLARPAPTQGKRRVLLWSAAIGFALGLTVQIGFITHHVTLAEPLLGTAGAGLLVSATGVTAFVGRLVLARIVDQVNVRRLAWLIMTLQTTALLAIALWPTAPVLIAASLVYGYGIGHVTTLGPVLVRREFGAAAFGATYGAAATVIQLTSAFGPALFGFMRDFFGGYGPGLMIASLVTAIGGLSLFIGSRAFRRARRS